MTIDLTQSASGPAALDALLILSTSNVFSSFKYYSIKNFFIDGGISFLSKFKIKLVKSGFLSQFVLISYQSGFLGLFDNRMTTGSRANATFSGGAL
jgi:hypothetical protein